MTHPELFVKLRHNHLKDVTDSVIFRSKTSYSLSKDRYDIYFGLLASALSTQPLKNPQEFILEANQSSNIQTSDLVFTHARLTHLRYFQKQLLQITDPDRGPQSGKVPLPDYQSTIHYQDFSFPSFVSLVPTELENTAHSAQAFAVSDLLTALSLPDHAALALYPQSRLPTTAKSIGRSQHHFHLTTNTNRMILCLDYSDSGSNPVAHLKIRSLHSISTHHPRH